MWSEGRLSPVIGVWNGSKKKKPKPTNAALYSRVKSEAKHGLMFIHRLCQCMACQNLQEKGGKYRNAEPEKWFKETVDISRRKRRRSKCGRKKASTSRKIIKMCTSRKGCKMTDSQKKSAVRRKRAKAQGVGGKPTNVKTFARKKKKWPSNKHYPV